MTRLLIVGGGGFGREVYQAVQASPGFRERHAISSIAYLDDGSPALLRAPVVATIADYAAAHPDLHECDEVGPHVVELGRGDGGAGPVRVDAVAVQEFAAVHVADAGEHRLVHQQRADRPAGLGDSRPGPGGVSAASR